MIHFLRNDRKTIVDIEVVKATNTIHNKIDILYYSEWLLNHVCDSRQSEFMYDIDSTTELDIIWHQLDHGKETQDELVASVLKPLAEKWGLVYVTD